RRQRALQRGRQARQVQDAAGRDAPGDGRLPRPRDRRGEQPLLYADAGVPDRPAGSAAGALSETCPRELDILFVPGGIGQQAWGGDQDVLAFLADRGSRAEYVTSVCGGSIFLGAAGLLQGYKATCHRSAREALRTFGAEPVEARVVVDRNRITGGGVTAGIDPPRLHSCSRTGTPTARKTAFSISNLGQVRRCRRRCVRGARARPTAW